MILQSLAITNFKNIADAVLEFSPKINCFLGNNGMGKSNLLDAIYYLSFCKSFSGMPDAALTMRGAEFTTLRGRYLRRSSQEELTLGLQNGRRKSFKRKGKEYERLSAHIGAFPLVMISPADQDLITGTGEERRRFMDIVISQSDAVYLDHLIRYNRALQQRNKLLRDHVVDSSRCINCFDCLPVCPNDAISYTSRRKQLSVPMMQRLSMERRRPSVALGGADKYTATHEASRKAPIGTNGKKRHYR